MDFKSTQQITSTSCQKQAAFAAGNPLSFLKSNSSFASQTSKTGADINANSGSVMGMKNSMPIGTLFNQRYPEQRRPLLPSESLSELLAADRKSKSTQLLSTLEITAANCAVGSTAGVVHFPNSSAAAKGGIGVQRVLGPSQSRVIDEVRPPRSQDPETNLSSLESCAKVNGDMTSYLKDIGVCPCARPKLTSTKAEVEAQAAVNPEDILSSDHKEGLPSEEKNKRASNFLKEVKGRLSSGEYKGFLECMRGLKNQTMNMSKLLQVIGNYFSAPERLFLLRSFGEFVPNHHRPAYNILLAAKHAEHGVPLGLHTWCYPLSVAVLLSLHFEMCLF